MELKTVSRRLKDSIQVITKAHCGCGWKTEGTTDSVITAAMFHSEEANHIMHFQGEVRPLLRKAVTQ